MGQSRNERVKVTLDGGVEYIRGEIGDKGVCDEAKVQEALACRREGWEQRVCGASGHAKKSAEGTFDYGRMC